MALSLSEAAAQEVRRHLAERGGGSGIRIVAEVSECSGLAYGLEFVDEPSRHDRSFECYGARIYVDPKSLVFVDGTQIDFESAGGETGFLIKNPNLINQCGCGRNSCVDT